MERKNIFVLAMTPVQRGELETVHGSRNYAFHTLLDYDTLVSPTEVDFPDLLARGRAALDAFDGPVHAIITHWDFPSSILGPVLARERGLPAPSLESLLKCEHKYWSRLEQRASVPECVPAFSCFDPFDDDALASIDVEFPFWIKPVKAFSSSLGFPIGDEEEFGEAVRRIRAEIGGVGDAFDDVLAMVDLPPELRGAGGNSCLAEQLVSGIQAAPEGAMSRGRFAVHGVFDMHKDPAGMSFERLDYPADSVPEDVQHRMIDTTERFLRHVGFDDGCFNSEFMYDPDSGGLWLIEVNTRISQSHSDLFAKVDGVSNHEVAIEVALGEEPRMPHRRGNFAVASQCMVFHDGDAVVTRAPTDEDRARIRRDFPETTVTLQAAEGDRLSDLPHQDITGRYIVAKLYIGARDRAELARTHEAVAAALPFAFAPVEEGSRP